MWPAHRPGTSLLSAHLWKSSVYPICDGCRIDTRRETDLLRARVNKEGSYSVAACYPRNTTPRNLFRNWDVSSGCLPTDLPTTDFSNENRIGSGSKSRLLEPGFIEGRTRSGFPTFSSLCHYAKTAPFEAFVFLFSVLIAQLDIGLGIFKVEKNLLRVLHIRCCTSISP